jgi:hypothetical protein
VRPDVLGYDDVVDLLIAACPSYEGSPERRVVDDADGEYIRIAGFVAHLVRLLDEQDTRSFSGVFGVVEWILEDADAPAVRLIQAGFLRDLADSIPYEGRRVRPVDFGRWLGPRARRDPSIRAILAEETP